MNEIIIVLDGCQAYSIKADTYYISGAIIIFGVGDKEVGRINMLEEDQYDYISVNGSIVKIDVPELKNTGTT